MSSVVTGLSSCLNCGADLHGAFCAECGQKASAPNPTFHDFFHELSHELLHLDGRLFQSITLLFTRPGFLTREHCEGRRARYAAPMRLYLTFTLIYFVLAVYAPLTMSSRMDPKRGRILHTGGLDLSGDVLEGRTDVEVAEWVHRIEHEWGPRVAFVMIPVFALFTAAATRRQHRHFPQHLYFALHASAAWFGILCIPEVLRVARQPDLADKVSLAAFAAIVLYTAMAVRTVYGKSWIRSALHAVVTLFAYAAVLVLTMVGLFVVLYFADLAKTNKAGPAASARSAPAAFARSASASLWRGREPAVAA